ncbi:OLC1v1034027C1 [Oldenlandia corymbosa var. corymbosa]|uniref:OLC1v1034027C1 n=1 Tax=Oldenlandia corymbosa var. corymbosa TaxID=529605 RepID=A0AAV1CQD3_OLDCO|nr:OLC1v1034027C1 [Oldenlandia corymbosa var. corymbosa]
MSRSSQNLKGLFVPRPPRYSPALPPPPPQFGAYTTASSFLLLRKASTTLVSFLKGFASKTLRFLYSSMEYPSPFTFPGGTNYSFDRYENSSSSSPIGEPLFLVSLRWWDDVKAAVTGGEIFGVQYNVTSSVRKKKLDKNGFSAAVESEIVLGMNRADEAANGTGYGDGDLHIALLPEWMFLKAYKRHNDAKDAENPGVLVYMPDLFSLKIRLSFSCTTHSLLIRINQKDNEDRAFDQAASIFAVESGLFDIWDFSSEISQLFTIDKKLVRDLDQPEAEFRDLQIYGLVEAREFRREKMMTYPSTTIAPTFRKSLTINGNVDNSISKQFARVDVSHNTTCTLGLTGLYNLKNTCFMNSVIQCLAHTSELVDYFLGDFRKELNFGNPLGMNGKLALAFGELVRKLWTPGAKPVDPSELKSVISAFAPQFSGYNQHDSQEFLACLLDGLHEDLNRVKSKPYIELKDIDGRPDDEVAEEHWRNHLLRNDSIIVDLYQGQYRSTLVCPVCKEKSVTFDPFMYLSLPLPSATMRQITLTIFSTDGSTSPSPVTVPVPKDGQLKDLVEALCVTCAVRDDETLLVAQVFESRIVGILEDLSGTIDLIRDEDQLVAYRLPKESEGSSLVVFTHERKDKFQVRSLFPAKKRFGVPLVSRIYNLSEGSQIRKEYLRLLHPFIQPEKEGYHGKLNHTNGDVTTMLNGDGHASTEMKSEAAGGNEFQFYYGGGFSSENFCIRMDGSILSSTGLQVLVSWPEKIVEGDYKSFQSSVLPQVRRRDFYSSKPQEFIPLYKCLDAFLTDESLGPEDMWYCPSCGRHQQACKKLDLWRLPEILVIHLKRFSCSQNSKGKIETLVDFPIEGFDLSDHMDYKNSKVSHCYSLYAVSNHYGSMGMGHYTSYVRLGGNKWYEFNDIGVTRVGSDKIKTASAYVLFYRRTDLNNINH